MQTDNIMSLFPKFAYTGWDVIRYLLC